MFCCMYVFALLMPGAQRPEEGVRSPEPGVTDASPHVGAVTRNPGPLQDQLVLLSTEPLSISPGQIICFMEKGH